MDIPITSIKPIYHPSSTTSAPKCKSIQTTIQTLHLQPHPEGGYYAEIDRHPLRIPNPHSKDQSDTRSLSSTIYYHLTPDSPTCFFHLNRSRTIHSLHRGRARYVIIHADLATDNGTAPVTSFVVGPDLDKGERMQWVVEGGKYKACYLLPDDPSESGEGDSEGLLIAEVSGVHVDIEAGRILTCQTVVPGFDFEDHEFLSPQTMEKLLPEEQCRALSWMIKKDG
jgi:predicted cupin superfamily sugar epimerase